MFVLLQVLKVVSRHASVSELNWFFIFDALELMFLLYALHSLSQFAACLEFSVVRDYAPKQKFSWFSWMALFVVVQDKVLNFVTALVYFEDSLEVKDHEKHVLAISA